MPVGVIIATCTTLQSLPALSRTFPNKRIHPGKRLMYRIRFRSTDKVNALTGVTAVVALPAGVSVLLSTTTPYPVRRNGVGTVSNSAITWQNLTIPAKGVRKFYVRMRVNQDVPSGTVLSFGCTLSQTNGSPNGDPYCSQPTQNATVSRARCRQLLFFISLLMSGRMTLFTFEYRCRSRPVDEQTSGAQQGCMLKVASCCHRQKRSAALLFLMCVVLILLCCVVLYAYVSSFDRHNMHAHAWDVVDM